MYSFAGTDIVGRYIATNVYRYIWLILFSLTGLFFVFDLMAELADVGKINYTLRLAAIYTVLQVPAHIYDIMPIATVAGAIVGLASLANNSEITVLRAAGLRPSKMLRYLMLIGIPLVLFTLVIGEWLQPMADQKAASIRAKALGLGSGSELKSGIWLRDVALWQETKPQIKTVSYINIKRISLQGEAQQLSLWRFDMQGRLLQTVQAELGHYTTTGNLPAAPADQSGATLLANTQPSQASGDAQITDAPSPQTSSVGEWRFSPARVQYVDPATGANTRLTVDSDWAWVTTLNAVSLSGMQKLPERLHMVPLIENVLFLIRNDVDARKPLSVLLRRLIHPIALWVMLALAMPFAYVRARGGAVAARVLAGVFMGIGFHTGNNLFQFLGLVQGWPVWLSAQMPVWIGLMLALFLFWRFHRLH